MASVIQRPGSASGRRLRGASRGVIGVARCGAASAAAAARSRAAGPGSVDCLERAQPVEDDARRNARAASAGDHRRARSRARRRRTASRRRPARCRRGSRPRPARGRRARRSRRRSVVADRLRRVGRSISVAICSASARWRAWKSGSATKNCSNAARRIGLAQRAPGRRSSSDSYIAVEHRLHERLLGREVPAHRADADAGAAGRPPRSAPSGPISANTSSAATSTRSRLRRASAAASAGSVSAIGSHDSV